MTNPAYRGSVIKIISIALAFWLVSAGGAMAAGPLVVGYSAVTSVFLPFGSARKMDSTRKKVSIPNSCTSPVRRPWRRRCLRDR